MVRAGIQVETELEPAATNRPILIGFHLFDRRKGKAGRFAYHGRSNPTPSSEPKFLASAALEDLEKDFASSAILREILAAFVQKGR